MHGIDMIVVNFHFFPPQSFVGLVLFSLVSIYMCKQISNVFTWPPDDSSSLMGIPLFLCSHLVDAFSKLNLTLLKSLRNVSTITKF